MHLHSRLLFVGYAVITAVVFLAILIFLYFSFLYFPIPPYNRIQSYIVEPGSASFSPTSILKIQRVAKSDITTLQEKPVNKYSLFGKEFSDADGQSYSVLPDGSLKKSGPQYSNDPFASPSGRVTLRFKRVSTSEPGAEPLPGTHKANVEVLDNTGEILQEFDSFRYGSFIDLTPITFSPDEKSVYFQAWSYRGGDFIDAMSIIKQSIADKSFEVVVQNPYPQKENLDLKEKNFVIRRYLGINPDKQSLYFEELSIVGDFYAPSAVFSYNYVEQKQTLRVEFDEIKQYQVYYSADFSSYVLQDAEGILVGSLTTNTLTKAKVNLANLCNIWDVHSSGRYLAVVCYSDGISRVWIYNVKTGKKKLLSTRPDNNAEMQVGNTYHLFTGFVI